MLPSLLCNGLCRYRSVSISAVPSSPRMATSLPTLGSMSFAVRYQINTLKGDLHEGDVLLTNHPIAGGSHLPDITCITPVFQDGKIVFFTASRGHHADVGGILPGSMPPTSKTIFDEGASIVSFKVVSRGKYQRDELVRYLVDEPAKYAGCSGTRCLGDVESDLKAQISANNKVRPGYSSAQLSIDRLSIGVNLINLLNEEYGLETFYFLYSALAYLVAHQIRDNAELAVRNLLKQVARERNTNELQAVDHLDDGTTIALKVTINEEEGSAVFDFEGTGPEIYGNLNAPISVTYSAIIYSLRAMVDQIPLNQGCLVPIVVKLPPGCCLDPSETAAVVGGNVCTSQRVTDVVLKAFDAAAASQGDCNNLTFGNGGKNEKGEHVAGFGYYETIAGGSGAGPTWEGTSGVHTHMTNTRITDPEIMERRYPVILHQFSLREGSGGKGQHNGGDGVTREIEFLESVDRLRVLVRPTIADPRLPDPLYLNRPIQCSILSERRVYQPYGLHGGESGECGRNLWVKLPREEDGDVRAGSANKDAKQPRVINLGGKATVKMGKGDRIIIETPGGGGWGKLGEEKQVRHKDKHHHGRGHPRGSLHERASAQEGV
ncbi:SPOSA6832_00568 [Sporobolomyces salmonicolor]|uniref:SPOSA6832_00568-mRNA-1:cds n=1 Tax=Sporidiobolus salmonicolor TaxID=5005 RepID=A0A0D6EHN6_SPOSA|nr:SPOSA6832_00568 [Sporobolomyces salmonicolor]